MIYNRTMKIFILTIFLVFGAIPAVWAHGGSEDQPHAHEIPAAVEANHVSIREEGDIRLIQSNGIPNHQTGQFPNAHNPNAISVQDYHYRVPLHPQKAGHITSLTNRTDFGVALNGIPFDPGTAEFYNRDPRSGWVLEAITGDPEYLRRSVAFSGWIRVTRMSSRTGLIIITAFRGAWLPISIMRTGR